MLTLETTHNAKTEAMKRMVRWCESRYYNGWCVTDSTGTVWPFDTLKECWDAYADMVAKAPYTSLPYCTIEPCDAEFYAPDEELP